jgi:hypothetical protein
MLAMSQEKLGAALGLTFQQVQKYEKVAQTPPLANASSTKRRAPPRFAPILNVI